MPEHPYSDQTAVDALEKYDAKINAYLPETLEPILTELENILTCMDRYCKSFYDGEYGGKLLAPFTYETQLNQYQKTCRECNEKIRTMARMYKTEKLIVNFKFTLNVRVLARRLNLGEMTLFQFVPEAFENIRIISENIKQWVIADQGYIEDLKYNAIDFSKYIIHKFQSLY